MRHSVKALNDSHRRKSSHGREMRSIQREKDCVSRQIGATGRLLNFFWPESGAGKPSCVGEWTAESMSPAEFAFPKWQMYHGPARCFVRRSMRYRRVLMTRPFDQFVIGHAKSRSLMLSPARVYKPVGIGRSWRTHQHYSVTRSPRRRLVLRLHWQERCQLLLEPRLLEDRLRGQVEQEQPPLAAMEEVLELERLALAQLPPKQLEGCQQAQPHS